MAGNSKRRGAIRKRTGGNPTAGSGGRRRRGLRGKGPTPAAADRVYHKAHRKAKESKDSGASGRSSGSPRSGGDRSGPNRSEWIVGRNPVAEVLRTDVPVEGLWVAEGIDVDERVREAIGLAAGRGIGQLEVRRPELDRLTGGGVHQGIAIRVPPYRYADPLDLPDRADDAGEAALIVALDQVTDPRNLGAAVRSAAAFGAHGVVVPERRSAAMTAAAWKTSVGAALRVPVARAVNLTRTLKDYQASGLTVIGLDSGDPAEPGESIGPSTELASLADHLTDPVVLVAGAEGRGLSRLVRETCDLIARIEMRDGNESLNASVAVGIALYEVDRARRARSD